jgi:hypothetical protein
MSKLANVRSLNFSILLVMAACAVEEAPSDLPSGGFAAPPALSEEEVSESEADGEGRLPFHDSISADIADSSVTVIAQTFSSRMSIWRDSCTNYWTLVYATNTFCKNHGWDFATSWNGTYYCGDGKYHKMWFTCVRN